MIIGCVAMDTVRLLLAEHNALARLRLRHLRLRGASHLACCLSRGCGSHVVCCVLQCCLLRVAMLSVACCNVVCCTWGVRRLFALQFCLVATLLQCLSVAWRSCAQQACRCASNAIENVYANVAMLPCCILCAVCYTLPA
jgi:hypothetical protein